jgi:hypothetical protein
MDLTKLVLRPDSQHAQGEDGNRYTFVCDNQGHVGMVVKFRGDSGKGLNYCQLTGEHAGKIRIFRGIPWDNPPDFVPIVVDDVDLEVRDFKPMIEEVAPLGSVVFGPDGAFLVASLFEYSNGNQGVQITTGNVQSLRQRLSVCAVQWKLIGYRAGRIVFELAQECV